MRSRPPTRVVERLRRLRERFAPGVFEHQVTHDHDQLTSRQRRHVPGRSFFLGEVWWTERIAFGNFRPRREGQTHRPGLVLRHEDATEATLLLAPSGP